MKYEAVIGLEVHTELKTKTKIFCGCSTEFGGDPNTHVCPVCLGLPGCLPVLNKEVVHFAIKVGLALHCDILLHNKFDRKNYYYPDLPKNFQTSQFDMPICLNGYVDIEVNGQQRRIHLTRIHMEEDAGKLVHSGATINTSDYSQVDYNRTGVPLLEIVSEPDIRSGEEARAYLEKLRSIIQYLEVSDCRLEEGSMRCDANISVRPVGEEKLGTKAEIKNINSLTGVQKGIEYEAVRQAQILEEGGKIVQETRGWDENKGVTFSQRVKEESNDYRYFPDPDLIPLE
ncbi:MAG: Asp-tRNA(Asn)/Glu-tRNA(Gln) amidotransferase subunit GatB, partial [Megasphaera micronuciformis]